MWIQTDKPLTDGWYWRKCKADDPDPECIQVINGIYVDKEPVDSHGIEWRMIELDEFKGWWWYGPLEVPPQGDDIDKRGHHALPKMP